jgi:contractile injection system tube protein/LysM domain-containing protein
MSSSPGAEAVIKNVDSGESLKCRFRPKEYTFAKTNSWPKDQKAGHNTPVFSFGGGQPATLQMELLFDTYIDAQDGAQPKDVREEYTNKLWKMMYVDKNLASKEKNKKGRPPKVQFQWGKAWTFEAVITSLQVKFTLFLSNGTPVRATATVAFQQILDTRDLMPPQNPTSGGVGGERVWTVTEGDTLGWIAYQEYGDTSRWRQIAEANRLTNVRRLVPGTVLVVPHG